MIKLLISPVLAWLIADLSKALITTIKNKRFDAKQAFRSGGMPSAHSATVSALTLAVYFNQGFSALFIVTLVLSIIVLRDATLRPKEVKHTGLEVLAGSVLGLLLAYIISIV